MSVKRPVDIDRFPVFNSLSSLSLGEEIRTSQIDSSDSMSAGNVPF